MILQQDFFVQTQRLNLIPRKFPFLELITVSELGDTPLVVEFVVGDLFGQGAILILAFADLDDGIEDTVEFFDSDPEETSAQVGRASVLVGEGFRKRFLKPFGCRTKGLCADRPEPCSRC